MEPEPASRAGEPTWEVAHLFPTQGAWSVADYLALDTNHLVELSDGRLEVLPTPTERHHVIVACLYDALRAFVVARGLGRALFAPLRIQLWEGKFREPDVVFLLAEHADRRCEKYWRGADLVMEVVSEDDPERDWPDRDWVERRREYARAGISEYWIVDPRDSTITTLGLDQRRGEYSQCTTWRPGEMARSVLLDGFQVPVSEVFAQQ